MKKTFSILLFLVTLVFFTSNAFAQIAVTVTNPANTTPNLSASYPSLALALTDLNNVTAMTGPVTLTLTAGGSETAPPTGLTIGSATLNPVLSATNTVTIVKASGTVTLNAGVGTATPGSAVPDGILKIVGADYITINGLTFTDGNASNPASMEFGVGLFKASLSDGAQNNTIKNCIFNMQSINNATGTAPMVDGSVGILVINSTPTAATTALVPTTAAGANNSNKFYTNTINGGNIGIALIGYAATTPFTAADNGNDIGGSLFATANSILNFGGAAAAVNPAAGVRTLAQYGLNISYNTINNNNGGGVNHPNLIRGIYTNTATSASETITFNTITINGGGTTQQLSAIENVAGATAASNTITITNNIIQNCTYTTATTGFTYLIYNNGASPANLNISSNSLLSNATASNGGAYYGIYNTGAATSTININSNTINGITMSTPGASIFRAIYNGSGTSTTAISINSNTIQAITYGAAGTGESDCIYQSNSCLTQSINSNQFVNLNLNTTGTSYIIYNNATFISTSVVNANSNSFVTGFTKGPGATLYLYYNNASTPAGAVENINNNNFSNITLTGATTFGGIQNTDGGAPTKTVSGNTISNVSGGTGGFTGLNITYGTANIFSNTISTFTGGGAITGILAGNGSTTAQNIYSNTLNGFASTGAFVVNGITSAATGTSAASVLYKNKIYDLSGNNASTSITGILVTSGVTTTAYNNIIGDLRATTANAANALIGISITGGTNQNLYNNTVWLNGTSLGALFGSSAVSVSTATTVDMRNNIFFNTSTVNGAAFTVAYRRSSTTLTTYANTSNNNEFYAGTPSATNVLFYDGTNSDQTLAAYKSRVTPRDAGAVSENTTFRSVVSSNANFLKIDSTVATQLESGGQTISSPAITDDHFGISRYPNSGYPNNLSSPASAPDIGANEFGGILLDVTGPSINYTALGNAAVGQNQTLTATITDASGVPIAGVGRPTLYFKINAGAYSAVTGTSIGSNQYTFTFGSGTTTVGDVVSYYIVAQDLAAIPNTSCFPSAGAAGFSINPPAVSTPPTTPSTYLAASSLSGIITVGTSGTYPNLTGASGFFNAVNSGLVTGNIYVSVLSNLVETGSVALSQFTPGYRIQIRPSGSNTTRLIEGTSIVTLPMIVLNGADNVYINGADSATNTGQYFRLVNDNATVSSTGPVVQFQNDSRQDSVRNCILESNSSAYATVLLGSTTGANGNDSIAFDNCLFKKSAGTNAGSFFQGYSSSGTGSGTQRNSDNVITNCTFTGMLATCTQVVNINGAGNGDNWTISNNKIYNDVNFTATHYAIYVNNTTTNNVKISGNSIGGSAVDRSGTFYGTSASVNPNAIYVSVGATTATTIDGNTISNFGCSSTGSGSQSFAINVAAGKVNIGSILGNTIGGGANPWDTLRSGYDNGWIQNLSSSDTVKIENNTISNGAYYGAAGDRNSAITVQTGVNIIRNNIIHDIKGNNTGGTTSIYTVKGIIVISSTAGQIIDGNTIYNLQNFNTGAALYFTSAIHISGAPTANISRNRIYNITSLGAGTGATAPVNCGIYNSSTGTLNIYNNQITLSGSTLEPQLLGINNLSTGNCTLLYNTIYLSGICANSAQTSYCYLRSSTSNDTVRNNLFYNERTGGANNYCIGVTSATGWTASTANYNAYVPAVVNNVGVIGAFTQQTFANWKTNSLGDASSVTDVSGTVTTGSGLFVIPVAGNLNIVPSYAGSWLLNGFGTPITTPQITGDYNTASGVRSITVSGGATDIGSNEFTPSVNPPAATASGAPANNTTTTYTFLGKTIGSIAWGAGGTVPTSMAVTFFPGTNPPGAGAYPVSNGYWVFTATGGAGYTYDITLNYDEAQLGNITPEADTRVAKSDNGGGVYTPFTVAGVGAGQYQLNTATNTITVFGLTSFSVFTLTDQNNPLPVELASFTANVDKRNVDLRWSTSSEVSNAGFDIERKTKESTSWSKIGYVAGNGNSNTLKNYSYDDRNVQTGKYNYRLKQSDYNGNFKYFDLSNEVLVGIPTKFDLSQNYPNPFNPTTKINYDLPFDSKVQIKIFDITGREMYQLVNEAQTASYYTVQFNASNLASGVYFYTINAQSGNQSFIKTMKMVLVK